MKAKDKLRATWSKEENDVMLHYPLGAGTKSDAHWLQTVFNSAFTEELTARGYDITTLKFEVSPKVGETKFDSQKPEGTDE